MNVSVIIPIYNAEKFLPVLFECCKQCNFESGDEILLVDNGSSDESAVLSKKQVESNPALYKYYLYTDKADSYAARNFAIKQALNKVLVFIDSDCKPQKEWLTIIKSRITEGKVLAGKIELEIMENTLWENFDSIAHLNSEKNVCHNSVATANMAVYKSDFLKVGYFTERFSGGDYDWSSRAVKKGLRIEYIEKMCVLHPSRKTFEEICKKEQRIAYGEGKAERVKHGSFFILMIKYMLKILKFDTNIRYTKELKMRGFGRKELFKFNISFLKIRIQQMKYARNGYREISARRLGLK